MRSLPCEHLHSGPKCKATVAVRTEPHVVSSVSPSKFTDQPHFVGTLNRIVLRVECHGVVLCNVGLVSQVVHSFKSPGYHVGSNWCVPCNNAWDGALFESCVVVHEWWSRNTCVLVVVVPLTAAVANCTRYCQFVYLNSMHFGLKERQLSENCAFFVIHDNHYCQGSINIWSRCNTPLLSVH